MRQEIPVWVINLNKRPDRLKKIAKRLDDLGIEWNRLEAVDGSNSSDLQLEISKRDGEIVLFPMVQEPVVQATLNFGKS